MSNVNTADVLERETGVSIDSWYEKVEDNPHLSHIPLTREQRCAHLPEMFRDLVVRLRESQPLGTMALTSDAAHDHGCLRRDQGYTAAMMVEESRMLQVSIFQTLKLYVERDAAPEDLLSDDSGGGTWRGLREYRHALAAPWMDTPPPPGRLWGPSTP